MRIIAGQFKSRRLKGTPPPGIRPTSDKLRETLFNVLGPRVQDAVFLDACSGTGGVGIEAISRGAKFVYFVDQSRKACGIVRDNLSSLGIEEGFQVLEMDLTAALGLLERQGVRFDIVFLDPPYDREDLYTKALELFGSQPLTNDGILVMEHSKRLELPEREGSLEKYRSIVHGDSGLTLYRKA
jgi:16S rRNA (guanine966-N2)-methyltransferase